MHDFCFTIPYGIMVLCGGLLGYLRRGSLISLLGGVGAGLLLLLASKISMAAYKKGTNSFLSLSVQTAVSSTLTWIMGTRYLETRKLMPAGTVAALSGAMTLFYLYKLATGGNHIPKKSTS